MINRLYCTAKGERRKKKRKKEMETRLLFFLSMIISIAFYLPLVSSSVTISVLSYNIRSGSNISDVYNITRTGETIKSLSPMLVGVQEVDNMTARHPGDDQPAILGSITGLTPVYGKMRDFEGSNCYYMNEYTLSLRATLRRWLWDPCIVCLPCP